MHNQLSSWIFVRDYIMSVFRIIYFGVCVGQVYGWFVDDLASWIRPAVIVGCIYMLLCHFTARCLSTRTVSFGGCEDWWVQTASRMNRLDWCVRKMSRIFSQVVEIRFGGTQGNVVSVPWLLLTWRHKEPGHRWPCYWHISQGTFQSQHPKGMTLNMFSIAFFT